MNQPSKVKIEIDIDEILIIMHCIRNSILIEKNAEVASKLYERLDKILAGI